MNNIEQAIYDQKEYCRLYQLPHFAPNDGICWICHKQIYRDKYRQQEAKTKLVTGCPHCHTSYCE